MKRLSFMLSLSLLALWGLSGEVRAVEPDEMLDDPAMEERARDISSHLRCVICQNQNIDQSPSPLARDLRLLIRERLAEGDTDQEVMDYVVDRYGDFVLLKPPVKTGTIVLWLAPVLLLLGGGTIIAYYFRVVLKRRGRRGTS